MTQQYHLSTDMLTPNFFETLKERFPHAKLDIQVKTSEAFNGLSEKDFWAIIAHFDWSDVENDAAIIGKAIQVLAEKPVRQIYEFQDTLSEKLHALDTRTHATHTGENAWEGENNDFSADEFLYARCCVVANGSDFYKKVLENPEFMPKNLAFESLLTIAHQAYKLKTGKQFRYVPSHNIETFANRKGWYL
jgi:ADP-heptose:LPS heptosyltransferase